MPTSPDVSWQRDELILVLHLYNGFGAQPPSEKVTALSRELRGFLSRQREEPLDGKVRSSTGISDKLTAFESHHHKTDPTRGDSALLRDVWAEFGRDSKRIWSAAQEIRERLSPGTL